MVSKYALLINLFLAFAAVALPPSQLGALPSRGEDPPPHPSDHSPSVHRRDYAESNDFAGVQHKSWDAYSTSGLPIDYVSTTLTLPLVDALSTPNSNVTFAVGMGDPETCVLVVGIHVGVVDGIVFIYPVWGTDLDNIQHLGDNTTPDYGDLITLRIYTGSFFAIMVVVNWSRNQVSLKIILFPIKLICVYVAEAMVLAARIPGGWNNLTDFREVGFSGLFVHYGGIPGWFTPPIDTVTLVDMGRGDPMDYLATAHPVAHGSGAFLVEYLGPGDNA